VPVGGETSVERKEEAGASKSSSSSTDAVRHPSHVAVPVVYNRRMLYLHAVCLSCLGALPEEGTRRGVRRPAAESARCRIACRFCGTRWTTGECLVLGTMYAYDVFACTPCCAARRACRRCGGPPLPPGVQKLPAAAPPLSDPVNFSDCSRLANCSWCGLEDYHYVKTFDEVLVCSQRSQ